MDLTLFATVPAGLESLLAGELRQLGASKVRQARAGVSFSGSLETAYRACLWSRLAIRVLLPLMTGPARDGDELYATARRVAWGEHLAVDGTLAVDFTGQNGGIRDTRFGAVRVKDAVVDQFRERTGRRPSVDARAPDLRVNAHLAGARVTLSLDLGGDSLHRRGYRADRVQVEAPLKENLAAAVLLFAAWPKTAAAGGSFADPLCGSGTLAVEAAWMAGGHRTRPAARRARGRGGQQRACLRTVAGTRLGTLAGAAAGGARAARRRAGPPVGAARRRPPCSRPRCSRGRGRRSLHRTCRPRRPRDRRAVRAGRSRAARARRPARQQRALRRTAGGRRRCRVRGARGTPALRLRRLGCRCLGGQRATDRVVARGRDPFGHDHERPAALHAGLCDRRGSRDGRAGAGRGQRRAARPGRSPGPRGRAGRTRSTAPSSSPTGCAGTCTTSAGRCAARG